MVLVEAEGLELGLELELGKIKAIKQIILIDMIEIGATRGPVPGVLPLQGSSRYARAI